MTRTEPKLTSRLCRVSHPAAKLRVPVLLFENLGRIDPVVRACWVA